MPTLLHIEGSRRECWRVLSRSQQHSISRPGCCKSVPRFEEVLRRRKMGKKRASAAQDSAGIDSVFLAEQWSDGAREL